MKKAGLILLLIIAAAASALILSCAASSSPPVVYQKNGKTYGVVKGAFRHRWWNYYERSLSYAEGGYYAEAYADIMEALRQRDVDQRMARSYGMHFLDYFPHRELGIILFHQGEYDDAEKELQTSLSMADSGKAKHFLNLVRKKKLEISKADTSAPVISLDKYVDRQVTNNIRFEIQGEVTDDSYARDIVINDDPEFIELSAPKIAFSKEVKLTKGINTIKIQSIDLMGKSSEKTVRVIADFEGPALNIENFSNGDTVDEAGIVLKGALADASGITGLKVNHAALTYNKAKRVAFAVPLELQRGENKITLVASDVAGNTTTGELTLKYIPRLARLTHHHADEGNRRLPQNEPILLAFSGTAASDGGQGMLLAATEAKAAFRVDFRDLSGTQTVFYEMLFVDGSAMGSNEIESVSINGEPLLIIPGRTVYFNQLLALAEGENLITIEITDARGNKASKTAKVIRKIQKIHQIGSRMSLALMPFELTGDTTMASRVVYDSLIDAFVDQERFHIVTRGDELEAILQEQKLSQTDLVDKATAIRIGKLVAAEGILMGSVRETKDSIEIYARLVNTETSTVLDAKDVYGQDKVLPQIQYLTNGLALKFKHSFPLIEGMVVRIKKNEIFADFGAINKIKKEMRFIVFKPGETIVHPVTGKILGSDTEELGIATVVSVFDDMSIGKLIADFDAAAIQVQDLIITK
jgi:TolB-like protein